MRRVSRSSAETDRRLQPGRRRAAVETPGERIGGGHFSNEGRTMSKSLAKVEAAQISAPNPQIAALEEIANQATPKDEIRWRKGRGGTKFPYTDSAYVIRTLNKAFSWDWDFEVDSEELFAVGDQPFEVKCRGKLTVRLNGQAVTKSQYGAAQVEMLKDGSAPVSIADVYKAAATDALKKCASLLGIALDIYDSDSPVHTGRQANGDERTQEDRRQNGQDSTDFWKQVKAVNIPTAEAAKIANRAAAKEITWAEAINELKSKEAKQ
jgi:hypothetical protein